MNKIAHIIIGLIFIFFVAEGCKEKKAENTSGAEVETVIETPTEQPNDVEEPVEETRVAVDGSQVDETEPVVEEAPVEPTPSSAKKLTATLTDMWATNTCMMTLFMVANEEYMIADMNDLLSELVDITDDTSYKGKEFDIEIEEFEGEEGNYILTSVQIAK